MEIELDELIILEIDGNKARVIKGQAIGIWHQFTTEDSPQIEVKAILPNLAVIQTHDSQYHLEIDGLNITVK